MKRVLVVGGGPGGSVAGMVLARAGVGVVLVEQAGFPRDKVCGECVSAMGVEVLGRVGVLDRVKQRGAVEINYFELYAADGRGVRVALPAAILGLSRRELDGVLLQVAEEAGVEVRQRVRCESMEAGDEVVVRLRDLARNSVEEVKVDWVVVADGKSSLIGQRPVGTGDFGIKAHFELAGREGDAVELYGLRRCYGGVAPIEEGLRNVAMSVPRERIEGCGDLDELFGRLVDENEAMKRRLRGGQRVGQWMSCALPRFGVRRNWPVGVVPVGNAAAALEPIGGEGMGLAMRSAEMAAEELVEVIMGRKSWDGRGLKARFERLWFRRRMAWRAMAMCVSRPGVCRAAVEALRWKEGLAAGVMKWVAA